MFVSMVAPGELALSEGQVAGGKWFVVDPATNVLLDDGEIPVGPEPPVESEAVHLLGLNDGRPVWAVEVADGVDIPVGGQWLHLRRLHGSIPEPEWALAGRAAQIVGWDRDHRFCGRCGMPTEPLISERARTCPTCRLQAFPRLSPAVIVLVERDDGRALLAWGRQFPGRFFSALAGFVEPGETLEEAVGREVKEEVGVDITDIRYYGSQPWPFPHSVMIGFTARYLSGEIQPQESEIVEAGWYRPDDLPPVPQSRLSIAGWLIDDWVRRQTAR